MQQAEINLTLDIDWPMLHRQKQTLLTLLFLNRAPTEEEAKLLDGLVNLIDYIQDQAEVEGLWVFPCGECGEEFPVSDEYEAQVAYDQHECQPPKKEE